MMSSLSVLVLQSIPKQANSSVLNGRERAVAQTHTNPSTHALDVDPNPMELNVSPGLRTPSALTLYKADTWEHALCKVGLFLCFIQVPSRMCNDFLVDFPTLSNI